MRVVVEETSPGAMGNVTNVSFYPGCYAEIDQVTWALRIFFAEDGARTVTIPADQWLSYNTNKVD